MFVSAAYKPPREGNWVIGVVLAALTAGLFFTGSVLKWDQESLEALEHNIEVGKLLGRFGFWFAPTFGGIPLLTRLYVVPHQRPAGPVHWPWPSICCWSSG